MSRRFSLVRTSDLHGINGMAIDIEVVIASGLPGFDIVGLADSAIRESRNRIRAAIRSSGFMFPNSRITASLAPAYVRKQGSAFDFPLALAILAASGQISGHEGPVMAFGELTLEGRIRGVPGAINRYLSLEPSESHRLLVPGANRREIGPIARGQTYFVSSLKEAAAMLNNRSSLHGRSDIRILPADSLRQDDDENGTGQGEADPLAVDVPDIGHIFGQEQAIRAACIAAAGHHNLLMLGSPGCGKTALAHAMIGILPPLSEVESIELTRIYSASGLIGEGQGLVTHRPIRAPHHTITRAAMIGGGQRPVPGEISLSHRGILFLDEMTEYEPSVLNLLRQPLEDQQIQINRNQCSYQFPAAFLLVGAANPCHCGHYLENDQTCRCSPDVIRQHFKRIAGPLLDRIDLVVNVRRLSSDDLERTVRSTEREHPLKDELSGKVLQCRERQRLRCLKQGLPVEWNGRISHPAIAEIFRIPKDVLVRAALSAEQFQLSVRGYHKLLRVARTIADLDDADSVRLHHLGESLQYRPFFGGAS